MYDPVTDTWRRLHDLPPGLVRVCGAGVARGHIVLVGMDRAGSLLVKQYNPCRDWWADLATRTGEDGRKQLPVVKTCVIDKPSWLVNKLAANNLSETELSESSGYHNRCFNEDGTHTNTFISDISTVSSEGNITSVPAHDS